MASLRERIGGLSGQKFAGLRVVDADEFSYQVPIDGSVSKNQGLRIWFEGDARAVLRLSGTGTEGATLRIYYEQHAPQGTDHSMDAQDALVAVRNATTELCRIEQFTGRTEPDVMT
jgi:phosphoglucomutase